MNKKHKTIEGMDIVDVTAAAVYLNNLPVPEFIEGKIRPQMFETQFIQKNPVKIDRHEFDQDKTDALDYNTEEEAALKDRLRGLGYLE